MIKRIIRRILAPHKQNPNIGEFLDAKKVLKKAKQQGLSIPEYIDRTNDDKRKSGRTDRVLNHLISHSSITDKDITVLEIGPGTGRYLNGLLARKLKIPRYEIYETADDWRKYLDKEYRDNFEDFLAIKPDGVSLSSSKNNSIDLIHSHAVFVYLRPLHVMRYIIEMARVIRPGGYIYFDYLPEQQLYTGGYMNWVNGIHDWPIFFPDHLMEEFTESLDLKKISQIDEIYGHGITRYIILQKI